MQADVNGAKYGGMLQTLPELYRKLGMTRLYAGGLARTIRTCGAFFIVCHRERTLASASALAHAWLMSIDQVSTIREKCIQYKGSKRC